ncbi:MAG: dipeptidase [Bryobacteraceae bacterium]
MRKAIFGLCVVGALRAQTRQVGEAEVRKVHATAIVIDLHNDVTSKTVDGLDIGLDAKTGHTDLGRLRAGNVGAQFFAAYVSTRSMTGNHAAHRALEMIDTIRRDIVEKHPGDFELATTAADIVRIRKQGKIAALIGIEGGHAIEESLRLLRQFHALGVRYMTLTHTRDLAWAGSSGSPANKGLSAFGKQVIAEMNGLGMMIDVSHVSDQTFWDAIAATKAPLIASHSSCRAISNVPRNMSDEMIRALGKNGGVIHINFSCDYLNPESHRTSPSRDPARRAERQAAMDKVNANPDPAVRRAGWDKAMDETGTGMVRATLADVVAHIDHVVKVAGVDHVGLGSDFDGVGCTPIGLSDVSEFPNLTRALLEKGYSAADVQKIHGGNTLRVMRAVEKAAQSR